MKLLEIDGLTFQMIIHSDPFSDDGNHDLAMVEVTLLNLDGDATYVVHEATGVTKADVDTAATLLAEAIALELQDKIWITRGAVKHQIRPTPDRPWHPEVYRTIRNDQIARGKKAHRAGAIAMKYAKRKGIPSQLLATYRRDHPK